VAGRVWKRGRVYWIQYSVNGRQYRESAETSRKEGAEALLRERLQSIWEGRFFPGKSKRKDLTVGALKKLWLEERAGKRSIRHDTTRLSAAVEHFGEHRLVSTLTADDVAGWRKVLKVAELATATVNRHLAVLKSALNLATERGHMHRNPMASIKLERERNERNRLCSADEYRALCAAAPDDLRLVIAIGYWTGMRLGEIVGLTWERIDLPARALRLAAADTKEASIKSVPLPTEAVDVLKAMPRALDGKLFRYGSETYSRQFLELCRELKITGMRFHDLRHTAATNMRRAGIDLLVIQRITGHKTLAMLKRYAHVTEDDLAAAMARTEAHAEARDRSKR
jgi:integrase